jgi:hypothetical protein
MQAAIRVPQPLSEFLAKVPPSAAWFALVACAVVIFFVVILRRLRDRRQERRAEIKRNALGALLYYVRSCEQHNLRFTIYDREELNDDLAAFDKCKASRIASMSTTERALFEGAAEEVKKLVDAINNDLISAKDRQRAIDHSANALRTKYQECCEILLGGNSSRRNAVDRSSFASPIRHSLTSR